MLAFIDIPLGVVAAHGGNHDFAIQMWSTARKPGQPNVWETLLVTIDGVWWTSWSGAQPYSGVPIDIYVGELGTTHFNDDYLGWEGNSGYVSDNVADDLEDLVPRPKALLRVEIPAPADYPAAWEAEISYPRSKGQVIGVEAAANQKSSALAVITYSTETGSETGCLTGDGVVRVSMVDPRRRTEGVRLILKPPDFSCASSGRMAFNDFDIASVVAYDPDGVEIDENDVDAHIAGGIR